MKEFKIVVQFFPIIDKQEKIEREKYTLCVFISDNKAEIYEKKWNKTFHKMGTKVGFYTFKKLLDFNHLEEEHIQKTWHPTRFQDWCMCDDEKVFD